MSLQGHFRGWDLVADLCESIAVRLESLTYLDNSGIGE